MNIPGHNQLDSRLKLAPRDYLVNPHQFGNSAEVTSIIPEGGDAISRIIAMDQHRRAFKINAMPASQRIASADITAMFDFSRQTWSRILNGRTWARQTGIAALVRATAPRIAIQMKKKPMS